jgi:4-hydroxy-tetrahydrodipicolinate synthase
MIFHGLSAFPITPADEEGCVDAEGLKALIQRLIDADIDSIGLLGSTGSYPYLSRVERRRAIEITVDQVRGRIPILVGIGSLRTADVIQLGQDAKAAGADAALLAPVSYTPLTEHEVFIHFESVAAAVDLPICIYNNPSTTNFSFSSDLIGRLSQISNIVAIKSPAPGGTSVADELHILRNKVKKGFSIGYSGDWNATEAMISGGAAWYSVAGGLFPIPCLQIVRAIQSGNLSEARSINARLQPLWDLFIEFGSLRVIYDAVSILGITQKKPPRPILPLSDAARRRVAQTLAMLELS